MRHAQKIAFGSFFILQQAKNSAQTFGYLVKSVVETALIQPIKVEYIEIDFQELIMCQKRVHLRYRVNCYNGNFHLMLLVAQLLAYKVVSFEDISTMEDNLATLFLDSKENNTEIQSIFSDFEKQYKEVKFYIIDKQDSKNEKLFTTPELQQLPQLYILRTDELIAESLTRPLTKENIAWFFKIKFLSYDIKYTTNITSEKQFKTIKNDGYIVYTGVACIRCDNALSQINKAAQVNKVQMFIINCSELNQLCEEKGLVNFPTLGIMINQTVTPINTVSLIEMIDEYDIQKNQPQNERIKNEFKELPKQKQKKYKPLQTDLKKRVTDLERRLKRLEEKLNIQNKKQKQEL